MIEYLIPAVIIYGLASRRWKVSLDPGGVLHVKRGRRTVSVQLNPYYVISSNGLAVMTGGNTPPDVVLVFELNPSIPGEGGLNIGKGIAVDKNTGKILGKAKPQDLL